MFPGVFSWTRNPGLPELFLDENSWVLTLVLGQNTKELIVTWKIEILSPNPRESSTLETIATYVRSNTAFVNAFATAMSKMSNSGYSYDNVTASWAS
jgi:hypothetical protein